MRHLTTKDLHAIVVYFAKKCAENPLSKKDAQKLMYIFQKKFKVSSAYKFDLYTYGVSSKELAGDLDILKSMNLLNVTYVKDSAKYSITAGEQAEKILNDSIISHDSKRNEIDNFLNDLATLPSWKLEIISTALYIQSAESTDKDHIADRVLELKPNLSASEVNAVLQERAATSFC